ncbi:MAG: hypothetical protein K9L56_01670 [Clostridiales bacterium]|nr:hypothetical protein [Clostridiales bacterium]
MFKRFLNLGFLSWKNRKNKGYNLSFYLENTNDNRNKLAKWLDLLGIILVTWFVWFILLSNYTKNQKALLLSLALIFISTIIFNMIKRIRLNKKLLHTRREISRKSYMENIDNMQAEELIHFTKQVLQKYGFTYNNSEAAHEDSCTATIKNKSVLWKFLNKDLKKQEIVKWVTDNVDNNYYHAIIITTRDEISYDIKSAVEIACNTYVEWIDNSRLAALASYIDHPSTSGLKEEDFTNSDYYQEKNQWQVIKKQAIGSRNKTRNYAFTGIILLILFFSFGNNFVFNLLYIFFAVFNIIISLISYALEVQTSRIQLLKP